MKIFTNRIFTHKKIILIFLLAIFLPALIAAYLSLSTFPKRREAVRNLLVSNLWIAGEGALRSVEGALLEYEHKVLRSEYFIRLVRQENSERTDSLFSGDSAGKAFLLNADFKIVFPETADEGSKEFQTQTIIGNKRFGQLFSKAENFEFFQKNYDQAAVLFKESALYAPTDQYRAIAFEGLGRCLLTSEKYDGANKVYNDLSRNYSQILNKAGHPYGIIAAFQLSEIAREIREEKHSLEILLNLYQKIREGTWNINQPAYDFYISEIESILGNESAVEKFPEIQNAYTNLHKKQSSYEQTLLFTNFLGRNAIPGIREKLSLARLNDEDTPDRFPVASDNEFFLISYTLLQNFQSGHNYYGGFCWDISFLKESMIPEILEDISRDSDLDFRIVNENNQDLISENEDLISDKSLALTFRTLPLPIKILASYPEIEAIEKSTRREIFFYGVLLSVIVVLMLLGAVLIARDISRESETNRLKTEFVNNISHELKTPLTLIRLYGETLMLKENLTDDEKKESYEIITKESERLSHLINNVLDFSRIEMGRKEFDFRKGYFQDVILDTLESYRYHLEKKGFTILSDIATDIPEMNFDGEAIASVLINLLSNAMKFSPKEKEVNVRLFRDNGNAVIEIADKGIGIPKEEIPKIFERFYQADNKTTSEANGSGLGLTLVKHIVEAHGGTIEVESEIGKGSAFTVRIPLDEN